MLVRQIVIDAETSGLDLKKDKLVELAAVELLNGSVSSNRFHTYINPGIEVDPDATKFHGLTYEDLKSKPKFAEIADKFLEFTKDAVIIYHEPFILNFINTQLAAANKKTLKENCKMLVSTKALAKQTEPALNNYSLPALSQHHSLQLKNPQPKQQALNDCLTIAAVYANFNYLKKAVPNPEVITKTSLEMRSITDTHYKTSMLINSDKLPLYKNKRILDKLKTISTYRPIEEITQTNEDGSPIEVQTPDETKLKRVARFGAFSIYSDHPQAVTVNAPTKIELADSNPFFKSEQYRALKEIRKTVKLQEAKVTPELLNQHKEEKYLDKEHTQKKKFPARGEVMSKDSKNISAGDYAKATQLFAGHMRWEWLSLLVSLIKGEASYDKDNIVAATGYAATEMMLLNKCEEISKVYPQGFELRVEAELIPKTHIATKINYTLKTPDFTLPLEFNALTPNKPHIDYKDYLNIIVDSLSSFKKKPHRLSSAKPILFFQKPEVIAPNNHFESKTRKLR